MLEQLLETAGPTLDDLARAASLPLGKIDITIKANGDWHYQGSVFERRSIVKLLARKLYRENNEYYLIAPEQRLKIQVEDLPFVVVAVDRVEKNNMPVITATTNCGEALSLGVENPLVLLPLKHKPKNNELLPAVRVRNELYARILRSAYYHLADWAEAMPLSADKSTRNELVIRSGGECFVIGYY
jgi:hypothetical protein